MILDWYCERIVLLIIHNSLISYNYSMSQNSEYMGSIDQTMKINRIIIVCETSHFLDLIAKKALKNRLFVVVKCQMLFISDWSFWFNINDFLKFDFHYFSGS